MLRAKGTKLEENVKLEREDGLLAFQKERFCAILESGIAVENEKEPAAPHSQFPCVSTPEVTMT
jgi:hypothetical protein